MANPMPTAEIDIDEALVRSLLVEQAPDLADLSLEPFAAGWDNAMFALGDRLLVRLPRRAVAVELIHNEQRWLPLLAADLPVAIPVPVVNGVPSTTYPWPWSIVDRVEGRDAIDASPQTAHAVELLSTFFAVLHRSAPDDAPANPHRGVPLASRDELTLGRFDRLESWFAARSEIDVAALRRWWTVAIEAAPHAGPPLWIHGDLHPGNIIVRDGEIVSVVDFGDLTSGDPATDLGSAWMLFDEADRGELRRRVGADDDAWRRARGWALSVALAIAENSEDNPRYEVLSQQTLARIASEG